jgi:hypothetical protein
MVCTRAELAAAYHEAGRFPDGAVLVKELFDTETPGTPVIDDYVEECLPCHVPARASDWVFVEGYPVPAK